MEARDFAAIERALTAELDLDCLLQRSFPSAEALKAAVLTAVTASLEAGPGGCGPDPAPEAVETAPPVPAAVRTRILDRVAAVPASRPELLAQAFALDEAKLNGLHLVPATAASTPALGKLVGIAAATRAELEAAVETTIRTVIRAEIEVKVAAASNAVAGAAEPVDPGFDTRPAGVPEFPDLPATPAIGVTEATDGVMMVMVDDRDFWNALLRHSFTPAANPEVLKAEVRRVLDPIASEKVEAAVAEAMSVIAARKVVTESWAATPDLLTEVRLAAGLGNAGLIRGTLGRLVGLAYPYRHLFEAAVDHAFREATADIGQTATAPAVVDPAEAAFIRDLALSVARHRGDPSEPGDANLMGAEDCGCVSEREENAEVYAFYPYWRLSAVDRSFDREAPSQVDFRLVDRIALYGIELRDGLPPDARGHIEGLGSGMVRAAHRYRAKADYAITLAGWQGWTDARIAPIADEIARLASPAAGPRPDGITLIFPGYRGAGSTSDGAICLPDEPCWRILLTVREVAARLQPQGQTLNIALDMATQLPGGAQAREAPGPLDELCTILALPGDCRRSDPRHLAPADPPAEGGRGLSYPLVDRVLVFLPRPTSDSKKYLRYGLDWGIYHGDAREKVLRRILPVVPPLAGTPSPAVFDSEADTLATDLVYYQDNFGGVAFWPAPDPAASGAGSLRSLFLDGPVAGVAGAVVQGAGWMSDNWFFTYVPLAAGLRGGCTYICPNRLYIAAAAGTIAGLVVLLVVASFVSGLSQARGLRRFLTLAGTVTVAILLAALSVCDPEALAAPLALAALMLGIFLAAVITAYQVARNGPMP